MLRCYRIRPYNNYEVNSKILHLHWFDLIFVVLFVFFTYYKLVVGALLSGLYMIIYALKRLQFLHSVYRNGLQAEGRIIEYKKDGEGFKNPVISFSTENGISIKEQAYMHLALDLMKFRVISGSQIEVTPVLYLKDTPNKFIVKAPKWYYSRTTIPLIIIGTIFFTVSLSGLLGYFEVN